MNRFCLFPAFNRLPTLSVSLVQKRVAMVIARLLEITVDDYRAQQFMPCIAAILDAARDQKAFGDKGQHDPRGDFSVRVWSMDRVQGLGRVIDRTKIHKVLERMLQGTLEDANYAQHLSNQFDQHLDVLWRAGFFGLSGHLDPRGDRREHEMWSMEHVEGIDTHHM